MLHALINGEPQLPNPKNGSRIEQSSNVQDKLWLIPGLISCAGVTGNVNITTNACAANGWPYVFLVSQLGSLW